MLITKQWQIYWFFWFFGKFYFKAVLVISTPWAFNFTEYTVQYEQDFAKFWEQLSSSKMMRQKIAADIISILLQYKCYSVGSRFEGFSDSASFLCLAVAKFDKCSLYVHQQAHSVWHMSTGLVAGIYLWRNT